MVKNNMDITLQRILSLLPHDQNGKMKHGAIKDFAALLGFNSGNLVSNWIAGTSKTYYNYLYQIASLYNVSVEWLRGETDIKNPVPTGDGLSEIKRHALSLIKDMTDEQCQKLIAFLEAAKK